MRIILVLFIFLSACNSGRQKDAVSFKDLEPLQGNWSGKQAVLSNDDLSVTDYPTTMLISLLKDSLELSVTNTYTDGHQETEKGILSINKDGSQLSLGPGEYTIQKITRTKDELTIMAFKTDEDNDKPADIRLTTIIRANELIMLREVKYTGTD
ncbi:MAG: hypothetical protein ABIN74_12010, partial [Ferruginibacter sp.]